MRNKVFKKFICKSILVVMAIQFLQLDISIWVFVSPKVSADNGIVTSELQLLARNNPDLVKTYVETKQEKIEELQKKLDAEIETTWYGKAKTERDKEKKEQLNILADLEGDDWEELNSAEREKIDGLLELEEVVSFMEEDGEKKEVKPTLVRNSGTGGLITEKTKYETFIPEKGSEGISLGMKNEKWKMKNEESQNALLEKKEEGIDSDENNSEVDDESVSVKFTQIDAADVSVKTEDNKALYSDIYPYTDLLLTTLEEWVKEDLILKRPTDYTETGSQALSGYQGENDWIFAYELELNGLTVEEADKGLSFLDENGEEVMFTPAPVMYDRLGRESRKAYFEIVSEEEAFAGIKNEKLEIENEQVEESSSGSVLTWGGEIVNADWETQSGSQVPFEKGDLGGSESVESEIRENNEEKTEGKIDQEEEVYIPEGGVKTEEKNVFKGVGGDWWSEWGSSSTEKSETNSGSLVENQENDNAESTGTGKDVLEENTAEESETEIDGNGLDSYEDFVEAVERAEEIEGGEFSEQSSVNVLEGSSQETWTNGDSFQEIINEELKIQNDEEEAQATEEFQEEKIVEEVIEVPVVEEVSEPMPEPVEEISEPTAFLNNLLGVSLVFADSGDLILFEEADEIEEEVEGGESSEQSSVNVLGGSSQETWTDGEEDNYELWIMNYEWESETQSGSVQSPLRGQGGVSTGEENPPTPLVKGGELESEIDGNGLESYEDFLEAVERAEEIEGGDSEQSSVNVLEGSSQETWTDGEEIINNEELKIKNDAEVEIVDSVDNQESVEVMDWGEVSATASGEVVVEMESGDIEPPNPLVKVDLEQSSDNLQTPNSKLQTLNSKLYVRLVADVSGLVYPIDLDPTIYVNLYDKGNRTFAPNFEEGSQSGGYSQTNNPGRVNRGTESTQTGGVLTNGTSSGFTAIDASGDEYLGNAVADSQDWVEVGDSLRTNTVGAKTQFTTEQATEIWAGLTYSAAGGIVKATVDQGTDFEVVNYVDTYADELQEEQKTLIATGLRNEVHTVELELTGKRNIKQTDPTYAMTEAETYVEDVFSTYLYTGNGSTQTIENGIDLEGEGGMVWGKSRNSTKDYWIMDTVRWNSNPIFSNSSFSEGNNTNYISSFNVNGFDLWSASTSNTIWDNYVSWTFREAPGFFDVVTYTGDGTSGREIAHDLGMEPGMIMTKSTSTTWDWNTYHRSAIGDLKLNATDSQTASRAIVTSASITNFTVSDVANTSGVEYVAYVYAHDSSEDGKIQCGSYTGNGSTDGTEVDLGWEPQWMMLKGASNLGDWLTFDNIRGVITWGIDSTLILQESDAEKAVLDRIELTSRGFKFVSTDIHVNADSQNYIYCAIRVPQKEPVNSADVFAVDTENTNIQDTTQLGNIPFPVDVTLFTATDSGVVSNYLIDRLRGGARVSTNSTGDEDSSFFDFDNMNAPICNGNFESTVRDFVFYNFKRAPGFFDVVAYEGDGVVGRTVEHNLGGVPELILSKARSWISNWGWLYASWWISLRINDNNAALGNSEFYWWDSVSYVAPTNTSFTVGNQWENNANSVDYISYLFASIPDVSKVWSYTGTATDLDINAGFTNGASFVLIKRTDDTGDWYFWDTERGIIEGNDPYLLLNTADAEVTTTDYIDPLDAGFTITSSAPAALNVSGGEYIYLAIANDNGETQPTSSETAETVLEQARLSLDYFETYSPNFELQTLSTVGTANGGSTSTLIDSATVLTQTDSNAYQGYALTFTSGENNGKTVYVESSSYSDWNVTLNYSPSLSATASGASYQLTDDGVLINGNARRGLTPQPPLLRGAVAEFGIEGNLPTNSDGKSGKGTFSVWVKPDFSATADALKHYVFDSGLQRLYYDGSDDKWHFEVWNGLDWTTVAVESAEQTFAENDSIHLSSTWDASNGLKLSVNNLKTTFSVTWTAQSLSANTSSGMLVIGSDSIQNNYFEGTLAEPQIFDYVLTNSEINDIYTSEVSSVGQAHTQKIEVEVADSGQAGMTNLLFNAPMVNTANDRIGTLAGGAKLDSTQVGTVVTVDSEEIVKSEKTGNIQIQGSSFTCGDSVNYEGQDYATVEIGGQCWFAENLNVGSMLASGSIEPSDNTTIEKWCYDNSESMCDTYGGLYSWDELMVYTTTEGTQGICPSGWHVPSDSEWYILENYVDPTINDPDATGWRGTDGGTKLKSGGSSNFNAFLAGRRSSLGSFSGQGADTIFWSSSELGSSAWEHGLFSSTSTVYRGTYDQVFGFSVRCLQDNISNDFSQYKSLAYSTPNATTEIIAGFDTGTGAGIAKVTIDGGTAKEIVTEIDTYNSITENNQRFLVATGLDSDVHTVKIEASGLQNLNASGAIIMPKFIETNSVSSVESGELSVNGRYVDNVIVQDYATLPNAIQFPDKGNIAESEHEGTIEMWLTGNLASGDYFVDTRDSSGKNGLTLQMSGATALAFSYYNGTGSISVTDSDFSGNYNSGNANHLVAKWWQPTDTTMGLAVYLNGQKIAENKSQDFVPNTHSQIILGNDSTPDSGADFDGEIYDFSIYSKAFDDGGVLVGEMVGTGSSVFNSYKSIATKLEQIQELTASGSVVNAIDNSNDTFYLERGLLLNASGATATTSDVKVYVNGLEVEVGSVEAGTYARLNGEISAIAETLTIDNIVDSNEVPSSGFLYLGNPSGNLKREKVYYSSYSWGTFSGLVRGVAVTDSGQAGMTSPSAWADDTIVEIVGLVTLASVPAENADVFVEYRYSGDAVDRSRSPLDKGDWGGLFLDEGDLTTSGWALDQATIWASGSGQMVTDLAGQTALMKVRGSEISVVLEDSIASGSTALFVIDEGTANAKSIVVDTAKDSGQARMTASLAMNLSDDLHTLRLVNLENQTLAIDAMTANGHAPILKSTASSEIFYEKVVADLNPETSGENQTNDVFYWNTNEDSDAGGNLQLKGSITANADKILIDSGTGSDLNYLGRPSGLIQIENEKVRYENLVQSGSEVILVNLTRGYDSTSASEHADNVEITPKGAWRNNLITQDNSWYQEVGEAPAKIKLIAMDSVLSLLNSSDNTLWMYFNKATDTLFGESAFNLPSTVVAWEGVIWTGFSGTGSLGLLKIDYLNDTVEKFDSSGHYTDTNYTISDRNINLPNWTTWSWENLVGNSITDLDLMDTYLAIATSSGVSVLNLTDDTTTQSLDVSSASAVKFDQENNVLYFVDGTTLYQVTDFTSDFSTGISLDLGVNLNAMTMNSDYLYMATDAGVKQLSKSNLTGGTVLTIDSNNTDATTDTATAVDYADNQLIITFSNGTESGGIIIIWDTEKGTQSGSYNVEDNLALDVLHGVADAGEDIVVTTEDGVTVIEDPEIGYTYNTIEIFSGNNQMGEMLAELKNPLIVRVSDGAGHYAGSGELAVNFTLTSQPTGIGTGAILSSSSVITDNLGYAQINLTLGDRAGDYAITADFDGVVESQTFTATEKEKFELKISGDKEHVFDLNPNGQAYMEKSNTLIVTHNAESFDFQAIVDELPTDGINTIQDWNGTTGFAWMDGSTPMAFGSGATVYSSNWPEINGEHTLTFRIEVDYYNPISQGYDGQVSWDVKNLSF